MESLWSTSPCPMFVLQMAMQLVLVVEVEVVEAAVNTRGREHLYVLPLLTTSQPYSTLCRSLSERLRRLLAAHLGKIITKCGFMWIILNIRHLFLIYPKAKAYLIFPPSLIFRTHCTLYVFITDYIKDAFLAQLHIETAARLEQATKALDQWHTCKDLNQLRALKVSRPLLQVSLYQWVLMNSSVSRGSFLTYITNNNCFWLLKWSVT